MQESGHTGARIYTLAHTRNDSYLNAALMFCALLIHWDSVKNLRPFIGTSMHAKLPYMIGAKGGLFLMRVRKGGNPC